jgi:hypothetical protein
VLARQLSACTWVPSRAAPSVVALMNAVIRLVVEEIHTGWHGIAGATETFRLSAHLAEADCCWLYLI